MNELVRSDFGRGEQIMGLVWLALGALFSLLLEVVYLGVRLPLGEGRSIAVPVTILVALWFNGVLSKTARLWSRSLAAMAIPVGVWIVGFFALLIIGDLGSVQTLGNNILTIGLLLAGVAGGVWPFFSQK